MNTSRTYQVEGVILKQARLGENDRILTVFTSELGKLRVVAKGACSPRSKFTGNVEPLTHAVMLLAKGRNLDILTQSQTINNFLDLKKDLWRLACGLYVLELVDSFTIEGSESRPLFTSLLEILNELNAAANSEIALRYFELRLLRYAGYRPQLQRCAICDQPLRPELNFFEPSKGGIVCPHCYSRENPKARYPVSVEALKVFRLWQSCDYATAKRIKLKSNLSTELDHVLHGHISYLLGKELKSRLWLQRLKKELLSKERTATVNQGVC